MKMEQTECSETLAYKIQTAGNYPEENIQHTERGQSLKSRSIPTCRLFAYCLRYNFYMLINQNNAFCFLFHAMCKLDAWTFHRTTLQHCWRHNHFSMYRTLHLCQKYFSTFKQEHVFRTSEKRFSFSPAAGTRHFSVPHRLVVASSQLIFQKTNQVKMWPWGWHCRVGAATMSAQIDWW